MPMNFVFSGPIVQPGHTCVILAGPPYTASQLADEPGANLPLQSATINADLEANFTIATRENFGLVLEDATGRIYARSNGRSLTTEEVSEAIEYSVHTLPQYFNLETIEAFLPEVPFTESGLEVAELEVSLQNGFVRASGLAYYRTALLSFTITFSYDFSLSRVTRPYWLNDTTDAIVQVDTEAIRVRGANVLQRIILFFFRGKFKRQLRDRIQSEMSDTINASVAVVGQNAQPTIDGIVIDTEQVAMEVTIWLDDNPCPGAMSPLLSPGERRVRNALQLKELRSLRNRMLITSDKGRALYELFQPHRKELFYLILNRDELAHLADEGVSWLLKEVARVSQEPDGAIPDCIQKMIQLLSEAGSPALRKATEQANRLLQSLEPPLAGWLKQ